MDACKQTDRSVGIFAQNSSQQHKTVHLLREVEAVWSKYLIILVLENVLLVEWSFDGVNQDF